MPAAERRPIASEGTGCPMAKAPLVLGIESSCDEMAAAVLESGTRVLSSVVHGQDEVHRPYGGVVPELASRDHVRAVSSVAETALANAGVASEQLSGIAVTAGPGLVGSLLVGVSFAKALAYRLSIPVVGVHHLVGHLMAAELAAPTLVRPYVGLVVSGGHTALYRIEDDVAPPTAARRDPRRRRGRGLRQRPRSSSAFRTQGGPADLGRWLRHGDREGEVELPRPMQQKRPAYEFLLQRAQDGCRQF